MPANFACQRLFSGFQSKLRKTFAARFPPTQSKNRPLAPERAKRPNYEVGRSEPLSDDAAAGSNQQCGVEALNLGKR